MTKPIRKVAVLGAGVMGSGIAAHCANAGIPVLLLDIVPPKLEAADREDRAKRNAFAAGAVAKMRRAKPAPLTHASKLDLIDIGNFDDDLAKLADVDLVIEAIIERLDIKQGLFAKLETITEGKQTIVASNTSGLRIADMLQGRGEAFRKRFMIMHFFNPPRYMKLLELVVGADTDKAVTARVERFGREVLGKGIVHANDVPNFIANRIGTHAFMASIHEMIDAGLEPEDIDAITGIPMGHPKSATFRTCDLVGLDTLLHVVDNCHAALTEDEDRAVFEVPGFMRTMVEKGLLGGKTKQGFYKKTKDGILTLDRSNGAYRARGGKPEIRSACKALGEVSDPAERVRKLVAIEGEVGDFAWKILARGLAYAARRVGEIASDIAAIDDAMRWGYNFELGPFQTWDALGFAETVTRMQDDGIALPDSIVKMRDAGATGFYHEGKVYNLALGDYVGLRSDPREATLPALRCGGSPVLSNDGAEAWDIGDGVLCVTFKSKANSIDDDNIRLLSEAIDLAEEQFGGVLIYNQGSNFCVGANLMFVAMAAAGKQWDKIGQVCEQFQAVNQRMKYASVPVVSAPYGMTLGGGMELCFGSDAVQAASETYAGLVEVGVGLIPGGGGVLNMLWRALGSVPEGAEVDQYALVTQVFKNIAMAKVATSAEEAKQRGFFQHSCYPCDEVHVVHCEGIQLTGIEIAVELFEARHPGRQFG
jgi:3-hydroxyacyl-CoA dehydrogenase